METGKYDRWSCNGVGLFVMYLLPLQLKPEVLRSGLDTYCLLDWADEQAQEEVCPGTSSLTATNAHWSFAGTSSIDTTCTIWGLETGQVLGRVNLVSGHVKTQLIAHDKEVTMLFFFAPVVVWVSLVRQSTCCSFLPKLTTGMCQNDRKQLAVDHCTFYVGDLWWVFFFFHYKDYSFFLK